MDGVKAGTEKVTELIPGTGKDAQKTTETDSNQNATVQATCTSTSDACKCQYVSICNL
jgi:hypothetical protein